MLSSINLPRKSIYSNQNIIMIITISGQVGSGKSTIGKELAKKLKYRYISMGEVFKKLAKEKNMNLTEFLKYAEKNLKVDKEIDESQKNPGQNCILDSRMGFYFANPDLKIWLKAPLEIRAKRIAKRESFKNEESIKEKIKEREKAERERYMRMYSVDIFDKNNYDLIIDTAEYNIKQVVEKIISAVKQKFAVKKSV